MLCPGVYICGHAYAWGPLGWLYPCEIQPLETRAAGAGINTASNMVRRPSSALHTFDEAMLCSTTVLCMIEGWP